MDAVPCNTLSYRYRSNCLKEALDTISATRRSAKSLNKSATCPKLTKSIRLSALVCNIALCRGSFDYVVKVSSLTAGKRIVLPVKSHARLNYWLAKGATLLQGSTLSETHACLWLNVPEKASKPVTPSSVVAFDTGTTKLLSSATGEHFGLQMKELMDKVRRKQPGSKAKQAAIAERKDYIRTVCKQIDFANVSVVGLEDLRGIKRGKGNLGKNFRKWISPWVVRQVHDWINFQCQLNRVQLVYVDPSYTSQTCPSCGSVDSGNRKGELFKCLACNHQQDSDTVGARNILAKTRIALGSLWPPNLQNTTETECLVIG